jgi:two-component system CheB/CheR fusion protein
MEQVRAWFEEAQLTLIREGTDEPLPVFGDADRLQQVQVNLLRNATKYTPAGGRVWYALGREDAWAVIRVRDTGVGMAADMLARAFEPFVQADETLDRASGGIGVGLTLVRSIVELHGGTAEARSDGPGRGSEFIVRLPLSTRHAPLTEPGGSETGPSPTAAPPGPRSPLRLLVVEDDADIRTSLVGLLELDGHTVSAVPDGSAGLALLAADRVDAALLDIGLPEMNGYELVRRIRARPGRAPYLIAVTGYGRSEDRAATTAAGFDAHLTKPFLPDELNRILSHVPAG